MLVRNVTPVVRNRAKKGAAGYSKGMVTYVAIVLISAATLLLELALLRIFAIQQFYHFAFMAISLALLGAGASGSLLSVRGRPYRSAPLSLAFSVTTVGAYLLINYVPFDSFSIAWDRRQVLYLALYFLAAATPFVFGGLAVGGELMRAGGTDDSHRVYGANLLGSAAGSLGSLPALALAGGVGAIIIAALAGAAAALFFALYNTTSANAAVGQRERSYRLVATSLFLLVSGLLLLFWRPAVFEIRLSPYKTLSTLSQAIDTEHTLTEWSATARIDVLESSTIHTMPGLSLLSPVALPPQAGLLMDGDNLMPITGLAPQAEEATLLVDYVPLGLAYRLRPRANTLLLEAGTGMDVLLALAAGATHVTAVEDNKLVVETVRDEYGAFTGHLYSDPRVSLETVSGRVFARRPGAGPFDLVVVSLIDPHRPVTSGAYTLTEDYVHTVGAFRDYLDVLDQDGLLFMTRWLQWPPSESLRTFGTVAAALRARGLDPATHTVAFRTLRTVTVIAGLEPFTPEEIETVRTFLQSRNYDAITYPGVRADEINRYHLLQDPAYHDLFQQMLADPDTFYRTYRFDVRPPTDNHPFFFHYFKWAQTPEILATLGRTWQPFGGSGYFVLVALLLLVVLASAALIIAPLLLARRLHPPAAGPSAATGRLGRQRLRVFLYFAGLGLGFLFVEVPLAQRFILILDEPVIALAVVIFSVLLFSGLGSLTVRRWRRSWALVALVLLVLLYPLLLEPFSAVILRLPGLLRLALTVVVVAPLGLLMGLPFAAGLRVVERQARALVPWAWAINGSFSVISSVVAVMVALSWDFSAVLWLGAFAYLLALFAFHPYS